MSKSRCYDKIGHDKCGSSDAVQVYLNEDGSFTGFCWNCESYLPNPYGEGKAPEAPRKAKRERSKEEVDEELRAIDALSGADLPDRKLYKSTLDYFGVKVGFSEEDRSVALHFYPYTKDGKRVAYRYRKVNPKSFWFVGDTDGMEPFGWEQAVKTGAKRIYVTEGECDAMALFQILKDKNRGTQWEKYDPAVVSLTRGAGGAAKDFISFGSAIRAIFKEVVLVFDNDKVGKEAAEKVIQVYPGAMTVHLPGKDPNECLIKGWSQAVVNAVMFNAAKPKNTRIISADDLFEEAKKPAVWGLSWPWQGLTKLTKGMRLGEVSYWGAAPKMGKSELVNTFAAHWMKEHGLKVFLAKPEEANLKSVKMVLGKVAQRIFHDPDIKFDEEAYDNAAKLVAGKLKFLDLYQHVDFELFKKDFIDAANEGCQVIVLDPLSNFVGGLNSAEANTRLQDIAQELAAMSKDYNVHTHVFCHLRNPDQQPMHERGGKVLSSQFAGSRGMARHCHLMLGLEGNRDPDLPEEQRNIRKLVLLEDREFGNAGSIRLYWNSHNGVFSEIPEE